MGVVVTGPAASPKALTGCLEPSVKASLLRSPGGPAWAMGLMTGASGAHIMETVALRTDAELRELERLGFHRTALWKNDPQVSLSPSCASLSGCDAYGRLTP